MTSPSLPGPGPASAGGATMRDLFLIGFLFSLFALGMRRPFLMVLAYIYIDIVAPQRLTYHLLNTVPISLIAVIAAVGGWAFSTTSATAGSPCGRARSCCCWPIARLPPFRRRFSDRSEGEMGLGVEGAGLCGVPAVDPAHEITGRGTAAVHDAVGFIDRHHRRDQDAVLGRRLWRAEPDGQQQCRALRRQHHLDGFDRGDTDHPVVHALRYHLSPTGGCACSGSG